MIHQSMQKRLTRVATAATLLIGALLAAPTLAQPAAQPPESLRAQMRQLIAGARDQVFPALVNISVVTVDYWQGKETKGRSTGSGTIISADGYVLTNAHVTDSGKKFTCTLSDKSEIPATLVGEDPLTDLAVLKLDLKSFKGTLSSAKLGDSDTLTVGDSVLAMGSPFSLSRSVTLGIVSNTERVFAASDDEFEGMSLDLDQRTGLFARWIQHDAAINPGNSGGPLVSMDGQVIGVNTRGGSNMSFAVPSNIAREVSNALIANSEVPRSWLGLNFRQIQRTGFDKGVLVTSVDQEGPAYKAGLRAGDLLLSINNEPLTIRFVEEVPPLLKRLADLPVGKPAELTYQRDAKESKLTVVPEKLLKDRGDRAALRSWGLSVQEITPVMARNRRLKDTSGVLVVGVRAGAGAATAEPALSPGDIIRTIDRKDIAGLPAIVAAYESIMSQQTLPDFMLVEFDRDGKQLATLVKPKPDKPEDPPREVPKAWLGVATQVVLKDLAKRLNIPDSTGFRVTRVYPGTKAAAADLRVGDIIVSINNEKIAPKGNQDSKSLERRVRSLAIDQEATLGVLREGKPVDVKVTLERTRLGPDEARRDQNRDFEMTVRELTFFDRDDNKWDESVSGVLVEQVEEAGWAGLGGLGSGDLIQQIGEHAITDLASYRAAMEDVAKDQPERISFVVLRGIRTQYKFVEPEWKPSADTNEPAKK
ncbi:MAG: PDZ domain-containing protein [Phycisphaerae bacterium]|nr:PDZ domain-containing protein [Phycisphaerae bacterium]